MRGWLAGLALVAACGSRSAPPPQGAPGAEHWQGSLSPPPPPTHDGDGDVIAEVNGAKIYAAGVARQAAARGESARAALDELIEVELLAQEALRRGLADDPEVVDARKRERVRRLIQTAFEPTFDGPEDVPGEEVDRTWNHPMVKSFYNHELYRRIAWVRVPLEKRDATPEAEAAAQRAADALYQTLLAARPADADAFTAAALAADPKLQHGKIDTTRHASTVEEFASAAFAIPAVGGLSRPARTDWGYDILYWYDTIPERRTSKAQAEPEIRKQRFEPAREEAFRRWVDALVAKSSVERPARDEALERVDVQAPSVAQ